MKNAAPTREHIAELADWQLKILIEESRKIISAMQAALAFARRERRNRKRRVRSAA